MGVTYAEQVQEEESSEEEAPRQTQRGRNQAVESDDESEDDAGAGDDSMDVDGDLDESQDQVVKKMVRYALACEFQRKSIKRQEISEKGRETWLWLMLEVLTTVSDWEATSRRIQESV